MWFPLLITIDDDVRRAFVARLKRAIKLADLTEDQACREMELKQSQWCDQCAGDEHLSFTRLMRLPRAVHCWFALLTLIDLGLPVEVQTFFDLFGSKKPMVKGELSEPVNNERTQRCG